ncbi:MAG: response regulator transcription factor [Bacteroidetes bacterium]|nr:response regulator transcription factor [Bacteroidota bacterium]
MKEIKVLIVDDHSIIRKGLRLVLESDNGGHVFLIDEVGSGKEAIGKIKQTEYDIVLMDYMMPYMNGAEATRAIVRFKPDVNVLAVSNYDELEYVKSIMKAGAKGYVLKNVNSGELVTAVLTVLRGSKYYSNDIALKLLEEAEKNKKLLSKKVMTKKEVRIIKLIAKSYTSKQIAREFGVTKRVVDYYRAELLKKMRVNNTAGLLMKAKKLKLIA